nr:testis-specific expressed protein 55-like [Lytechinus pictus]
MADSEDQPVLLTEGSIAQEDSEKDSGDQDVKSVNETEPPNDGDGSGGIVDQPAETPPTISEDARPSTAPEAGLSASTLQEVERSVLKAVSETPLPDSLNDGEEGGDDFNEAMQQDTLSDRLEYQLPCDLGDDIEYIAPPEDPYMRAVNYMEKHKVMQMFQKLTAEIVYHRPSDPLNHMLSELQKMKKERDAQLEASI